MSFLPPVTRIAVRKACIHPRCLRPVQYQPFRILPSFSTSNRHQSTSRTSGPKDEDSILKEQNRLDSILLERKLMLEQAAAKRKMAYSSFGVIFGMICIYLTATSIDLDKLPSTKPPVNKLDSGRADDPLVVLGKERKVVIQKLGEEPEEIPDTVKTGASAVPEFPRVLEWADNTDVNGQKNSGKDLVEYQLLGLGVRTVSFLGIQVYVVGLYIATDDIAALQSRMIQKIAKGASTLVAGEKGELQKMLYDPEEGVKIWEDILKDASIRTLVRIVPTRNTDFGHLRDAWVRCLTAKAQREGEAYGDEAFGLAVGEFKKLFNRGSVPKGKELLLSRDGTGKLVVWYDDGKTGAQRLGQVADERVSRAVWLNYLAGKTVASEPARKSIIEGLMEFVERPVGTVATQVHV